MPGLRQVFKPEPVFNMSEADNELYQRSFILAAAANAFACISHEGSA
jgi:hypothetical protein